MLGLTSSEQLAMGMTWNICKEEDEEEDEGEDEEDEMQHHRCKQQ